jgi:hypothetical protein
MKSGKRISNRLELDGMTEGMAFREMGQLAGGNFIAVKKG